jgi:hypothetical protein
VATRSVFEIVNRDDYKTEADYIKALYDTQQIMASDTYREYHRKELAAARAAEAERITAAQNKAFSEARGSVSLSKDELTRIDDEAQRRAKIDLARGDIQCHELGARISEYASYMTERKKDGIAAGSLFNAILRGQIGAAEE